MDISERTNYVLSQYFFSFLLNMYHIVSVISKALQIFVSCMNSGVNVCFFYFCLLFYMHKLVQYVHYK